MGMACLKAALDGDGCPIVLEVRTAMQEDEFGPESSFDVTSRFHVATMVSRQGQHPYTYTPTPLVLTF